MKKLLLILLGFLFLSCSNDDAPAPEPAPITCNCNKISEQNIITNATNAQTGWTFVANSYPNFTTDCSLNGQISNVQSEGNGVYTRITRFRIVCN